jgi:epsilon-lactone hydrolase
MTRPEEISDWSAAVLMNRLRAQKKPGPVDVDALRIALDSAPQLLTPPPDVKVKTVMIAGRPAEWLIPPNTPSNAAILYLHGGGFVAGGCTSHRYLASAIAQVSAMRTLVLEYRLAPEHPLPAGLIDSLAAWLALYHEGIDLERSAIIGDSAGGGLTIAALQALRDDGRQMPPCAVLMSPWLDLAVTSDNARRLDAIDPSISVAALRELGALACKGGSGIAPLNCDLSGLPPILIQATTDEILCDDAHRLHAGVLAVGGRSELDLEAGLCHVYQSFTPRLAEARAAIARIAKFLQTHCRRAA